jgi:DNA-directed RNA polymerase subunit RPC12/RpoP
MSGRASALYRTFYVLKMTPDFDNCPTCGERMLIKEIPNHLGKHPMHCDLCDEWISPYDYYGHVREHQSVQGDYLSEMFEAAKNGKRYSLERRC